MSLERFHKAQASRSAGYDTALAEIRRGRKKRMTTRHGGQALGTRVEISLRSQKVRGPSFFGSAALHSE